MFKVGDKGKTRGDDDYEVISVNSCYKYCGHHPQPVVAIVDGDEKNFSEDGTFDPENGPCTFDLIGENQEKPPHILTWQQAVKDFALHFIETYDPANAADIATAALEFTGED